MSEILRIWHITTEPVVYASSSIDLACLEKSQAGWNSEPAQASSKGYGDRWLGSKSSLIAEVPSVIVPEEGNLLIKPLHFSCNELKATAVRRWAYDSRLI